MPHLPWLTLLEGPTDHPSTSIWELPSGAGKGAIAHQAPALAGSLYERAEGNELLSPTSSPSLTSLTFVVGFLKRILTGYGEGREGRTGGLG